MKTPKRTYVTNFLEWDDEFQGRLSSGQQRAYARWKRKNRVKQLKRTIARLTDALIAERKQFNALWLGDHLKRYSPEWDAFMQLRRLKTPEEDATLDEKFVYWVALREVGKSVLNAACLAAMDYGESKGKEEEKACACRAINAENAKQEGLTCADAEQQAARKEA